MSMPLVSCLMPAYNAERFLRRALDSMQNQTYQNFEMVIIIEHGCTDSTEAICSEYMLKDKRVRLYVNENKLGIARSLNRGLELCKGKYIARMDTDDVSYSTRLEKQVSFMEENENVAVLGTWSRILDDNGNEFISEPPTDNERIRAELLFGTIISHPTVMLRADLFHNKDWQYPEEEAEDYALWTKLISKAQFANLPEVLLDYYQHGENATLTKFAEVCGHSSVLSRRVISNELGVDTSAYSDLYFGWRGFGLIPYDIGKILLNGAKLIRTIQSANDRMHKFEKDALISVLRKHWRDTKSIAHLSFVTVDYDCINMDDLNSLASELMKIISQKPRTLIYGTGSHCQKILLGAGCEDLFDIVAFCDSDTNKHGTEFFGREIIAPEQIKNIDYDYIFIASPLYEKEIRNRLTSGLHVPKSKIFMLPSEQELSFLQLRVKYNELFGHINGRRNAYLFCAPDYGDLGDHAIAEAARRFFRDHCKMKFAEVPFGKYHMLADIARHHIKPDDLILIAGGGFPGSLWFTAEYQARQVIEAYPNNPVVVLPQREDTLFWAKERGKTQSVYTAHTNLTLCARDKETYELMYEMYPGCRIFLIPDMALSDNWNGYFDKNAIRGGMLLCMKTDKESILTNSDQEKLQEMGKELCGNAEVSNMDLGMEISAEARNKLLTEKISNFCKARLIVTDRMHGLIFAAVTGTPCVALNDCNNKLWAAFDWLKHLPYLRFANDIVEVETLSKEVLSVGSGEYDMTPISSQFRDFKEIVKGLQANDSKYD